MFEFLVSEIKQIKVFNVLTTPINTNLQRNIVSEIFKYASAIGRENVLYMHAYMYVQVSKRDKIWI